MTEYDGVRPSNAVCPSCHYRFGGIPIQCGQLTCPECAHAFSFVLPPRRNTPWPSVRRSALLVPLAAVVLAAGALTMLYQSFLAGLIVLLIGAGIMIALRRIRRALLDSG